MKCRTTTALAVSMLLGCLGAAEVRAQRQVEPLDRGVVAIHEGDGTVYVGWRLLREDPDALAFNVYRAAAGADPVRLNEAPITASTNLVDTGVDLSMETSYFVRPVLDGEEQAASDAFTLPADAPAQPYLAIPLQDDLAAGARLVGTGDLDGDGTYDFVVKRGATDIDPSQDPQWTETYKLEGYTSEGTYLWRFDLGVNIRPGIWYSPFIVYDLDGDGKAEVATKIGEIDDDWNDDGTTDYREPSGRILSGPEYLVILDGETGEIVAREDWIARGDIADWGDDYGNRANRNMLAITYLDGERPSLVTMRGLYGGQSGFSSKMVAEAWNYRGGELSRRWIWTRSPGGAGFQNYRVGDIDGDGRDELVHGSVAIDDDGAELWVTGEGHGDRLHMTDIDPGRPGLEIWYVQEGGYTHPVHLRDAETGALLWGRTGNWGDVGRGIAADIDPRHEGLEVWASRGDLYSASGEVIGDRPSSVNLGIWWDDDALRELLDGLTVDKWDWENEDLTSLAEFVGDVGSRNAPMGYGDVIGDWREEVWYTVANRELRIYTTTIPTDRRYVTFMHDTDYRTSVAAETVGYMQSTQPSFYVGADETGTAQGDAALPPDTFRIEGLYPNPFNPATTAVVAVRDAGRYDVTVHNVLGQVVHRQAMQVTHPGRVELALALEDQASGLYLIAVRHQSTHRLATAPAVLLK